MRIVLSTFPDLEAARQVGTLLVEMQLAACVNLVPGVESIFRWQGKIEHAAEVLAVFKTTADAFPAFAEKLAELHPYDVPEIIALTPEAVAENYAAWVAGSIKERGRPAHS
ncbi:MAG: divalent-cation tolerance protein CutA [Verrucomicrobiota bacterium]